MIKQKNALWLRLSLIAFVFANLLSFQVPAQTHKIDQLRNELYQTASKDVKLKLLLALCAEHPSMSSDSLLRYITIAEKVTTEHTPEYFLVKHYRGAYLSRIGQLSEGINVYSDLLNEIPKDDSRFFNAYMRILNSRGIGLVRNNQIKAAIEDAFVLLKNGEEHQTTLWIARAYLLLGYSNMELIKYADAIEYFNKCIQHLTNDSLLYANMFVFSNIASCYNNIGAMDSAFKYINLALKYGYADENLSVLANAYNIRADMYVKQRQYALAGKDMEEALQLRKKTGDIVFVVSDMAQLAFFYASIGATDKGIEIANNGLALVKEKKLLSKQLYLMNALAENYRVAGKKDEYAHALTDIIALKDTMYQKNTADEIAALEAKYQLQKKENIIIQQENKLVKSRYIAIGSVLLVSLISITAGLLYRNRQLVKNRKMERQLIAQQVLAAEAVKQAQEAERKRIAADLHDNLGAYAAAISNNVKQMKDHTMDEFVAMEHLEENAQNMVTQLSDTIWVLKNEELTLTKLSDRFKVWMQRLMKNYPGINYHFSEDIKQEVSFTPVNILHLFYILKECVNNALKHSECSDIFIVFESHHSARIDISDNGKGIKYPAEKGNGMEHIKQRAAECNWQVAWLDEQPHGTKVMLTHTTK
jgi:signal transduction histidine kinase